ncbi:5-formyltetrahydrofolate cyclo-ligase [Sphingomonas sp.]|uniref:5-formyltetrahydrofolate cyclo-ligase n=1 Tax=Sphingomonas sp. TaxID=28214 RepID=UPI003CC6D178
MTGKPALRARLRAARDGFAPVPFPPSLAPFVERLSPNAIVASYIPVGGEVDPSPLVAAARAQGCRLALPHLVDRAGQLRFLAGPADAALMPGPFGLRQPAADLPEVAPTIILTPLVGFDRRGNRLGQGAGHYDRAFAAHPGAWRVGLAWSVQEVDTLRPDPWDVPLHAIITEQEWITP